MLKFFVCFVCALASKYPASKNHASKNPPLLRTLLKTLYFTVKSTARHSIRTLLKTLLGRTFINFEVECKELGQRQKEDL